MGNIDLTTAWGAMADCLTSAGVVTTAHRYPTRGVDVGEAVPGVPGDIELGITFGRGSDRCTLPLIIVAGLEDDPETWQRISDLLGKGSESVSEALEPDLGGAVGSVAVLAPSIVRVATSGDIAHMAARFEVEVIF